VKASSRRREGEPEGGKAQEGIGLVRRLNTVAAATDSRTEQGPEGGATERGASAQARAANRRQPTRGHGTTDEVGPAVREGKPLKGEPWTWLWGETNPQGRWRIKPSRA